VIESIIKAIFGDSDTKKIKQYTKDLSKIRELEKKFADMSLEDIQKRNLEIRQSFEGVDFMSIE
jgi:preprotein translocase subunit SecA